MDSTEYQARLRLIRRVFQAFGIGDADRIEAVVDCTLGIPWLVPPLRGDPDEEALLFAEAVAAAALESEYGAPNPANIMTAAMAIAGTSRSENGTVSNRRWVRQARQALMGLSEERLKGLTTPAGPAQIPEHGGPNDPNTL